MQSCVQNITTVRYLLDLYEQQHGDVTHSGLWTATSLDVNVFLYVIILWWCYINEYCKCCSKATAMKFYTNNFIEYIYKEI